MKITLMKRIRRWMKTPSTRAAPADDRLPGVLSPAQMKRVLMRLHDLEWRVHSLTEQCSALQETASAHDWSLEALWEQVYVSRPPSAPAHSPDPNLPKKKTLN